jgi:hypothetical protein
MAGTGGDTGLLTALMALPALILIWFFAWLKSMSTKLDKAHQRTSDHELHVSEHYVKNKNFDKFEERLFEKLKHIEGKINGDGQ